MTDGAPPTTVDTLGVLLVHGIGSQQRGDTLLQAGGAIHQWLRRWLVGNLGLGGRRHEVDVVNTSLVGGGEPGAPASTRFIFREVDAPASESPRAWLVAESCWADTFRPPSYGEFVRWVTFVVPFAVILHLLPPFRRAWARSDASPKAWRPLLRVFAFGLLLVPIALSGVVLQSLLLAMIVVALLPLGFVRSFAGWVQETLALTIGDSYVFVTSPITESAIVSRVQRDLDWLAARCDRVVVVAHSHDVLVEPRRFRRPRGNATGHRSADPGRDDSRRRLDRPRRRATALAGVDGRRIPSRHRSRRVVRPRLPDVARRERRAAGPDAVGLDAARRRTRAAIVAERRRFPMGARRRRIARRRLGGIAPGRRGLADVRARGCSWGTSSRSRKTSRKRP